MVLAQEHAIEVPYSTLTRLIREHTQLRAPKRRSGIYTFEPGEEMQHDTSPHRLELAGKQIIAQCVSLILAGCRMLFFQYYPTFTRFEAKVFLAEALRFFDGSCRRCTIDNTSVILAGGSGPDALIAPEMEAFGALFGLRFIPHAIGHSDRKGRIERPFPASMLPALAKLFAVSLEELVGMEKMPAKRGPASVLQRQIEQIGLMPRAKQKFITEMLDAMIKQQQAAQG